MDIYKILFCLCDIKSIKQKFINAGKENFYVFFYTFFDIVPVYT